MVPFTICLSNIGVICKKVSFEPPALSSYKGNGERFYCFVLILKEKTYLEADGPYMLDVISIERSLMGLVKVLVL